MVGENMRRFSVTLSEPVVRILDDYKDYMGISRSAAIASIVTRQLVGDRDLIDALRRGAVDPEEMQIADEMERSRLVEEGLLADER